MRPCLITLAIVSTVMLGSNTLCPAANAQEADDAPRSAIQRLNRIRQEQPRLYLPTRFAIGKEQQLIVKAGPNKQVKLFISPDKAGYTSDDGVPLAVGEQVQALEATTNANGVAVMTFPVPDNTQLEGHRLFVDGYVLSATQGDDAALPIPQQLVWMDPTGRQTQQNDIPMRVANSGRGAMVLPGIPGIGGDMLRRIGTMQDAERGGDRVKGLVDDGVRSDTVYDNNVFIQRPDGTGGAGF